MLKIIVAPGAFKHSLSAPAAAQAMVSGLRRSGLEAELIVLPIADGGSGTLDALLAGGGQRRLVEASDPLGRPLRAAFGLLADGETAVVEMALASGLELLRPGELNPLVTTSAGTGQLMQAALAAGVKRIIIGLGGSATVDGGAGCLQALGVRLLDAYGQGIAPGGGQLAGIYSVDTTSLDPRWRQVEVLLACDVDNPAVGPQGAAEVFGPQKGAGPHEVRVLEAGLRHFFSRVRDQLGVDVLDTPGGGAAGALAAGLVAVLNARIASGVDLVLEHAHFDEHMRGARLVITGEGQMDAQTIHGKGPLGVARRARAAGVPCVAIVGSLRVDDAVLREAGIDAVLPIMPRPMVLDEALRAAAALVEQTAYRLGCLLQLWR